MITLLKKNEWKCIKAMDIWKKRHLGENACWKDQSDARDFLMLISNDICAWAIIVVVYKFIIYDEFYLSKKMRKFCKFQLLYMLNC